MKIETERLIIRPFRKDDLSEFRKLLDIQEVTGWVMQKDRAEDFLNWQIANYSTMDIISGVVCFGVFCKTTGKVFGTVGAGQHDDLQETEIFYNLLTEARGKGYATEATKAITKWVFKNYDIPYIIGTVEINNNKSYKVLERCGYHFIDTRPLLVHIENKEYIFKYYRYYSAL